MSPTSHTGATAGLIFPSQLATSSIDSQLRQISKAARSISNRLQSIASDAAFVSGVQAQLALPLVANERCGSWYVKPEQAAASVYFKSTDGHFGQWSFSLRRLNLHVLDIVGQNGGCIIVDSTRRGKQLPDALSKTIPIWCAVMNRLLFPDAKEWHALERLPELVSDSEYSNMNSRLDQFVRQANALDMTLDSMRAKLQKPMKIFWVARSLGRENISQSPSYVQSSACYPVVLCMASVVGTPDPQRDGWSYVQGAADDSESWSRGLTPTLFWAHQERLLSATETELPELVESLLSEGSNPPLSTEGFQIMPASAITVGTLAQIPTALASKAFVIICSPSIPLTENDEAEPRRLELVCGTGKLGSRALRRELAKITGFLNGKGSQSIWICCPSGKDLSVGVALAILVLHTDDQGHLSLRRHSDGNKIDKAVIRKKLSWIMASVPGANPSRATLNAVNSFLMERPA